MPRKARLIIPGLPHHITQRGNRRQNVFFNDDDRQSYLNYLKIFTRRYGIDVIGYCLMTNHVHLCLVPHTVDCLNRLFKACHAKYALRINKRHGWSGHLWQERFFSSPVDEEYLLKTIGYIELNPVRAKICDKAESYVWSSARARLLSFDDHLINYESEWNAMIPAGAAWGALLEELNEKDTPLLRERFARNLPCGSTSFINRLQAKYKRRLDVVRPGRPPAKN